VSVPAPPPNPPSPAERLERLKVIVKHLADIWPHLQRRQLCMQSLGRRDDLRDALAQTYASHITDALQDVLVMDLMREIGALVLDPDSGSASVARAMSALRDPGVIAELRAEYEIVTPLGRIGGDPISPEMRAAIQEQWAESERRDQLVRFEKFRGELAGLENGLKDSQVGQRLWTVRNRGIGHYDLVREGSDWKLWSVAGTGLRWGEVNTYVDTCSKAIGLLYALVCQTSFDFDESKRIAQEYVDDFIEALVLGLRAQKERDEQIRRRLMEGRE
jgi:AbiU2